MATHEIWQQAGMTPDGGFLCIGCLEGRLGREMTAADFLDCPLNDPSITDLNRYAWSWRTPRLLDRLTKEKK
jgi:hypothetical protein